MPQSINKNAAKEVKKHPFCRVIVPLLYLVLNIKPQNYSERIARCLDSVFMRAAYMLPSDYFVNDGLLL